MEGASSLLCDEYCAFNGRHWEDTHDRLRPIDSDHSGMVKFGPRDHNYEVTLSILRSLNYEEAIRALGDRGMFCPVDANYFSQKSQVEKGAFMHENSEALLRNYDCDRWSLLE